MTAPATPPAFTPGTVKAHPAGYAIAVQGKGTWTVLTPGGGFRVAAAYEADTFATWPNIALPATVTPATT